MYHTLWYAYYIYSTHKYIYLSIPYLERLIILQSNTQLVLPFWFDLDLPGIFPTPLFQCLIPLTVHTESTHSQQSTFELRHVSIPSLKHKGRNQISRNPSLIIRVWAYCTHEVLKSGHVFIHSYKHTLKYTSIIIINLIS